jgi:hypothetical protein
MKMPKYENQNDLANEQAVAAYIGERHGLAMEKLNPVYRLDYAGLRDGNVSSFFEIKCRTFGRDKYDTMMINAHKVASANYLMQAFGRSTNLVVRWTDYIGYIPFNGLGQYNMGMGGRFDRNDPKDRDICIYIPVGEFKEL